MVAAAKAFLDWFSRRVLLFDGRPIKPIAGGFWYVFVIMPTTLLLMPVILLAGVIEAVGDWRS